MELDVAAQDRTNPVGKKVERRFTIPWVEENTTYVRRGRLTIGIEHRTLDDEVMARSYSPEELEFVNQHRPSQGFDSRGIALHVIDGRSGTEYLRFDAFPSDPHYHYLPDGEWQYVVAHDLVAGDDFYTWTIERLRQHLPPMLRFVGADELAHEAEQLDLDELASAVDEAARSAAG